MSAATPGEGHLCPRCGRANECGMEKGETTCWCFELPHLLSVSETEHSGRCYCRQCLSRMIADREGGGRIDEQGMR
jgi:hypothetical protein